MGNPRLTFATLEFSNDLLMPFASGVGGDVEHALQGVLAQQRQHFRRVDGTTVGHNRQAPFAQAHFVDFLKRELEVWQGGGQVQQQIGAGGTHFLNHGAGI